MMYLIDNIVANIKGRRLQQGMTQEQLAEKLGLSFQTVSKWENAKSVPNTLILPTLAAILQCEIGALYKQPNASLTVPEAYKDIFEMVSNHWESCRTKRHVSKREQYIAMLSPDGRHLFSFPCINDRGDEGLTAEEEQALNDLAVEGMTVGRIVCMWSDGSLDLPSIAFRRGLLRLDPHNKDATILMQGWDRDGRDCYVTRSLEAGMPLKDMIE